MLLLAWRDSLLLALMLSSFLTWSWLIDWCRGATGTSRASPQGKLALVTKANTGLGKETVRGLPARGARMIRAGRDVKKGKVENYHSDCAVKAVTSQGMDDKHAKKLWEGHKEIIRDFSLLKPSKNPEPQATSSGHRQGQSVSVVPPPFSPRTSRRPTGGDPIPREDMARTKSRRKFMRRGSRAGTGGSPGYQGQGPQEAIAGNLNANTNRAA